jgi:NADH-quinone oxidoreductase subunit N
MTEWLPFVPLAIVVVGALAIMLADAIGGGEQSGLAMPTAAAFGAAGLVALAIWAGHLPLATPEPLEGLVAVDRFGIFLQGTLALGGALAALLAGGYFAEHEIERGELYPLLLFSGAGAMLLSIATELLVLFIGLETMSLAVYAMVGFRRTHPKSAEAAMKYFLLGSFAAAILLYGFALLYVVTGETTLSGIGQALAGDASRDPLAPVAVALVLVGLAFKVSAVPFHMWTPDAYEGAPTPVTAFMSVAVKAAAFAALLRFLSSYGQETPLGAYHQWPSVVAVLAIATMTLGNLVAMHQTNLKRMLAYSSIAHAGYLLLGVLAAWRVGDAGRAAVLYYLLAYTASNAGAFGSVVYLGSKGAESVDLSDFAGVAKRHPAAALCLALFMLSLAGVPPTAGFFGKLYLFRALMDGGHWWLVVVALVNSAIGAYYYLYVIVVAYMKEPEPGAPVARRMRSGYVAFALLAAAALVIQMGVLPGRFLNAALSATF